MVPLFKVRMSDRASSAVKEVLESGYIGQGKVVDMFESALKDTLSLPRLPVTTSSCTAALDLAYELIGIGPGDKVITTPMTCFATNAPLVKRGAHLVWADIDMTGLIDPRSVKSKLDQHPDAKAIVAVDWGGSPCDYDSLIELGPPVVRDAAHSFLADYDPEVADYTAWSFQAIKHLTTGDGGALLVPSSQLDRAVHLRWYGFDRTRSSSLRCTQRVHEVGFKYHMNDIAAAIGMANLTLVDESVRAHVNNAKIILDEDIDPHSSYWFVTKLSTVRHDTLKLLNEAGIAASQVHVRNDLYPALSRYRCDLPVVTEFDRLNFAVPCGWWLENGDAEKIHEELVKCDVAWCLKLP